MASKRKKSEFDTWFEQQHGKSPSKLTEPELVSKMRDAQRALQEVEIALRDLREYNVRYTSARWAWNALTLKRGDQIP